MLSTPLECCLACSEGFCTSPLFIGLHQSLVGAQGEQPVKVRAWVFATLLKSLACKLGSDAQGVELGLRLQHALPVLHGVRR